MLTPDKLHGYQQKAVNFQCSMPHSMLWLDMRLGKSAITLTSIVHLLNAGFLRGVVIDSVDAGKLMVDGKVRGL